MDLMNQKKKLEQRLEENKITKDMDENTQIKKRREQIAELHKKIEQEKERKKLLNAKVQAYKEIKTLINKDAGNTKDQLRELLGKFQEEKKQ